jgi:glycine betaine/proline transport system permease protein
MSAIDEMGNATRAAMERAAAGDADPYADIRDYAQVNGAYYERQFGRLDDAVDFAWTFNWAAAIFGPVWMAARRLWVLFWIFALIETFAVVEVSSGLWANLGAAEFARAQQLAATAAQRADEARAPANQGSGTQAALEESAKALQAASQAAARNGAAIAATRPRLLAIGLGLLLLLKFIEGSVANWAFCRRFAEWRSNRALPAGINWPLTAGAALLTGFVYGLTASRFAGEALPAWLVAFPASNSWRVAVSETIDAVIDRMTAAGAGLFDGIVRFVSVILDAMEAVLVTTPWPVTMAVIAFIALKRSGWRMAAFTVAAMAYLALMSLWEKSMVTVALLGTASLICIVVGCPLGICCAKSRRVYKTVRPILDLMQTMPPFVYLIPAIAFFGIGKPPGILATVIFGLPPMVHLTVHGIRSVPASVREAAVAFGASRAYLLFRVELPLALPSIMIGVSQATLLCLSMVVVASLIGAKGLGEDILNALAQVAPGAGIIAGVAVLLCAIVLDRLLQGKAGRKGRDET